MKSIKSNTTDTKSQFYRFRAFVKDKESDMKKTVGSAYLHEDQSIFTLRVWTFLQSKFFLVPNKDDARKYYVYTREPNSSPNSTNKYFWNIVGNAQANPAQNELEIRFDLFDKTIYLNLFPETSPGQKVSVPDLKEAELAA